MPLTPKGEKIKKSMERQYGEKKSDEVFYASKNKGSIEGVDRAEESLAEGILKNFSNKGIGGEYYYMDMPDSIFKRIFDQVYSDLSVTPDIDGIKELDSDSIKNRMLYLGDVTLDHADCGIMSLFISSLFCTVKAGSDESLKEIFLTYEFFWEYKTGGSGEYIMKKTI